MTSKEMDFETDNRIEENAKSEFDNAYYRDKRRCENMAKNLVLGLCIFPHILDDIPQVTKKLRELLGGGK